MRASITTALFLLSLAGCGDTAPKAPEVKKEWTIREGYSSSIELRYANSSDLTITCSKLDKLRNIDTINLIINGFSLRNHEFAGQPSIPYALFASLAKTPLISIDLDEVIFSNLSVLQFGDNYTESFNGIDKDQFWSLIRKTNEYSIIRIKEPSSGISKGSFEVSNLREIWPSFLNRCQRSEDKATMSAPDVVVPLPEAPKVNLRL